MKEGILVNFMRNRSCAGGRRGGKRLIDRTGCVTEDSTRGGPGLGRTKVGCSVGGGGGGGFEGGRTICEEAVSTRSGLTSGLA